MTCSVSRRARSQMPTLTSVRAAQIVTSAAVVFCSGNSVASEGRRRWR